MDQQIEEFDSQKRRWIAEKIINCPDFESKVSVVTFINSNDVRCVRCQVGYAKFKEEIEYVLERKVNMFYVDTDKFKEIEECVIGLTVHIFSRNNFVIDICEFENEIIAVLFRKMNVIWQ